jgi:hypothetical protein
VKEVENIIDFLLEKTLSEIIGAIVPPTLAGVFAFVKREGIAKFLKNVRIRVHDEGILLDIYISSKEFSGDSKDIFNSIERKFRSFDFKKTEVTKSTSPEKDKYILSNFKIDPIKSVEILLTIIPSDDNEELIVTQIKLMIITRISQHRNDKHFDTIRELIGQIVEILGCRFSAEYAFVINVPEGKEFLKFEGAKGYKFKCVDVMKEGRNIRIANQHIEIHSEFDNTVQNLINELSLIAS